MKLIQFKLLLGLNRTHDEVKYKHAQPHRDKYENKHVRVKVFRVYYSELLK